MKKITFFLFFIIILFTYQLSYAQNSKTITLKDGSQIKGNVSSLNNGVYSVDTSFGAIEIQDNDIVSISAEASSSPANPSNAISQGQMAGYQKQILSNPQVFSEIQNIAQDPEIQAAFSDPEFAQAVMAQDMQKVQNNPKFKELLKNPKMQKLINAAGQAIGQPVSY